MTSKEKEKALLAATKEPSNVSSDETGNGNTSSSFSLSNSVKKSSLEKSRPNKKKRNWAFVVYPESAPENWQEILREKGLQCAISPLHDKDLNADGSPKKPHWHVIAIWQGPTSFSVVKEITDSLNAPMPIPLEQIKGYYRYFTHKDNPEKYQYDEKEITAINGFSVLNFVELSKSEVLDIKKSMIRLITEKRFFEYSELCDYLLSQDMSAELDVVTCHTIFFTAYIKGKWRVAQREQKSDTSGGVSALVDVVVKSER